MRLRCLCAVVAAYAALASTAMASCLDVEWGKGRFFWINSCGVGIEVTYLTEGDLGCESNKAQKYPCAAYIPPRTREGSLYTWGERGPFRVEWVECESPGGPADVIAVERGYGNVVCVD